MFTRFLMLEIESVREEYLNVKKCQHTFFIFELTATGAILSYLLPILLEHPERQTIFHLFLVFAPVIVIIPSMYIIFDKGISLNRIAGFLMVAEYTISRLGRTPQRLEGWERGCLEFRRRAGDLEPAGSAGTQGPNRFYELVFSISVALTAICSVLFLALYYRSDFTKPDDTVVTALHFIILLVVLFAIGIFVLRTYSVRSKLQEREHTILSMANLWWKILEDPNRQPFSLPSSSQQP